MAGSGQKEKKEISSGKSLGVFDIGSNTVLLTGGRLNTRGQLEVLIELHDVARLSEGLVDGGPLQEAAKARTLNILSQFKAQANSKGVQQFLAAGTAAFRRASDGSAFAQEIQEKLEIPVKIIPGEREAHYSYLSAQQDFGSSQNPVGVIDIGGGAPPNWSLTKVCLFLASPWEPFDSWKNLSPFTPSSTPNGST